MEKLKPCPFCGYSHVSVDHNAEGWSYVQCHKSGCMARTDGCLNDEEAIRIWNRRASIPLDYAPAKYAHYMIDLHHYFEDNDFGDLRFYANITCSNCGKKIIELSGDTVENPSESYKEHWDINPKEFYEEQLEKIRAKLSIITLENYCPHCGCIMVREEQQ